MSKKDNVKAKISFFQAIIVVLVTTLFAIFGYTAIHYKEFDYLLGIGAAIGVALLIILLCVFGKYFKNNLDKLENMK